MLALACPATSGAVTITVGRPDLSGSVVASVGCTGANQPCQSDGEINLALSEPQALLSSPADGTITSWRIRGNASANAHMHLTVVQPQPNGSVTATAVGPDAGFTDGRDNNVSLSLAVGESIGLFDTFSLPISSGDAAQVYATSAPGGSFAYVFTPTAGANDMPGTKVPDQELLYNATVDLFAPALSSVSPQSGAGGTVVTITGQHLAVVKSVTFGGVPATNVTGDNSRITATAPPRPQGGPVDVQVVTAGGTSVGVPLDVFTYPTPPPTTPSVSSLGLSAKTFRAVNVGGSVFSVRTGTRVSYKLSEVARVTFTVKRRAAGRRMGKRCVTPRRGNRRQHRCTRLLAVRGSFTQNGVAGVNRFNFSGRMNRRALAPGSYRLYAVARNASGKRSRALSVAFRIVR